MPCESFTPGLEAPAVVGIEATGTMQRFLELREELGIECRVGHPAKIRAAETRKQKHDRRDAHLLLDLQGMKGRFPEIWMPSTEQRDLNLTAGPTTVGEDTSTIAAHLAGDRAQSRPASRPCALECCGAECATGVTSATLQQSETDGTGALVRTVTDTNPGTG
jgi:hypothetical protein